MGDRELADTVVTDVATALEGALVPLGFEAVDAPDGCARGWVRKTWNTNRGVVLVQQADLPRWAAREKLRVGKDLGYFPFFYGLGLQVVCVAPGVVTDAAVLQTLVDKIDNQRCIIQSVFALDPQTGALGPGRTWGQVFTGKFQDAIAHALAAFER